MNDMEKYDYIEKVYGCSQFSDTDIILKLLSDSDECVRIEMIEACYACEQKLIHNRLFQMLENVTGLEKGYLLLTLSYIYQKDGEKIVDILKNNIRSSDEYEKMDSCVGLIIIGYRCYLKEVLEFLESEKYYVRCAALNMLSELIRNNLLEREDIKNIKNVVSKIRDREETRAVNSSIHHLFEIINQEMVL